MTAVTTNQVNDLLKVCEGQIYISDYKVSESFRKPKGESVNSRFSHLRSNKIQKWASKEGAGRVVKAFGFDELDNVIAIMPNNSIVQFIG